MSAIPQDPPVPSAFQNAPNVVEDAPARETEMSAEEAVMSAEEEAALCARYEEERQRMDHAETPWGSDWPEGPLLAAGCGW